MNEEQKDKGLKKAIKEENGFRLPSNFAYHTMRKVDEHQQGTAKSQQSGKNAFFHGRSSFRLTKAG